MDINKKLIIKKQNRTRKSNQLVMKFNLEKDERKREKILEQIDVRYVN